MRTTGLLRTGYAGVGAASAQQQQGVKWSSTSSSSYPPYLLNTPETKVTTLPNGIRVATEEGHGETATVGVWINTGSVYETEENNGVAHFLEHMTFKGSAKRTQHQLEVEVEDAGMKLNAYTSREQTVFFANSFKSDIGKAVDVLADIVQNPKLEPALIETERGVILREYEEIESLLDETMMDHLHAQAFQGTPLGLTILGSKSNIRNISREQLLSYISTHYIGPRMVIAGAGAINHEELVKLATSAFSDIPSSGKVENPPASKWTGSSIELRDDTVPLVHLAVGAEAVGWTHPDFFVFSVLQTIIGNWARTDGTGRNTASRLSELLSTEQLAHSLQTFYTPYHDTGIFGHYMTTTEDKIEDASNALMNEWPRIANGVNETEVEKAKSKLKSQSLLQLDGSFAVAEDTGRQLLALGRRITPAELFMRIDAVDTARVKQVADKYLTECELAAAAYGPIEHLPDYQQLRGWHKWNRL